MRAVIRTPLSSNKAIELLRETLTMQILRAAAFSNALDAEIALTHLIGMGMGRYIAQLPTLTGADSGTLAARIGPVLGAYLYTD